MRCTHDERKGHECLASPWDKASSGEKCVSSSRRQSSSMPCFSRCYHHHQSVMIVFRQLHQGNGSPAPSVSAFDGQELLKTGRGVDDERYDRVRVYMYSYMLLLVYATFFSSIYRRRQAATAARRSRLMGMTCRRDAKLRRSFDGERVCEGPLLIILALEDCSSVVPL